MRLVSSPARCRFHRGIHLTSPIRASASWHAGCAPCAIVIGDRWIIGSAPVPALAQYLIPMRAGKATRGAPSTFMSIREYAGQDICTIAVDSLIIVHEDESSKWALWYRLVRATSRPLSRYRPKFAWSSLAVNKRRIIPYSRNHGMGVKTNHADVSAGAALRRLAAIARHGHHRQIIAPRSSRRRESIYPA